MALESDAAGALIKGVPLALILSSYVAASLVGGGGQKHAFAAFKIDTVLVPSVLFGRHPGKGPPGGGAVEDAVFESVAEAALGEVALTWADAVVTGYFASAEQVRTAARAIDGCRGAPGRSPISGRLAVVVDPIMGDDDTGLYVREAVAAAVAAELLPRADWLTPNLWELERLTGARAGDPAGAAAAARRLPCPALVTSVPCGAGEIGVVCVAGGRAVLFAHALQPAIPRGTGDLVTAVFTAGLIEGLEPFAAAERAVCAAAETAQACVDWRATELPLVALGDRIVRPTVDVRIQELP